VIDATAVLARPDAGLRSGAGRAPRARRSATEATGLDEVQTPPCERLETLFRAHADRLFRLAARLVGEREEAKDLVQETFVRVARQVHRIPPSDDGAEAWLVRTLVNLCRDRGRRLQVRRRWQRQSGGEGREPSTGHGVPEARLALATALRALSPVRRAAVLLCELEGHTPAEAGRLLGLRPPTVRWHLALARRRLREALRSSAPSPSEPAGRSPRGNGSWP
jgi:RNA polymerase sigma-70 factor (ECF subfamily)